MARTCIAVFLLVGCGAGTDAAVTVTDVAHPVDLVAAADVAPVEDVAAPPDLVAPEPDTAPPVPDVPASPPDVVTPPEVAAPKTCFDTTAPGHHEFKCAADIAYEVEIPATCPAAGCGLIVDMHGWTMNAGSEDANTEMRQRGTAAGYVVIQPTAPGLVPSWDQTAHAPLVFAFLSEVSAALGVDPKRIHAMGFSQGGGMTWRLLCDHADTFASVSPIGALEGCAFKPGATPSREVPILAVHGTEDAVVNFDADPKKQKAALLAAWPFDAGVVIEQDDGHKATRYTTTSGTVFEFWEHHYKASSFILNGHCFPGSKEQVAFPVAFGCTEQGTFVYGELALKFFQEHPAP